MDILYNCCSLLRIIPRKGIEYIRNYITGDNIYKTHRLINTSNSVKIYNHISNVFLEPTKIIDNIYLGNAYNASNYSVIRDYNIKYIINATRELPNFYEYYDIKYLRVPVADNSENHISDFIQESVDFIDNAILKNDGNILIHCYMGSSRSASIVTAYLIHKYKYNVHDAICFIKNKRDIVNINLNFIDDINNHFS